MLAVGTRLQDFTTGSWALFKDEDAPDHRRSTSQPFDAGKHGALPLVADARVGARGARRRARRLDGARRLDRRRQGRARPTGSKPAKAVTDPTNAELPSDAQVIGAVQRGRGDDAIAGLRRGRPAGRTAQALAGRRARQLPPRIRLLVHGLRDRRRPRRQDGASPTRDVVVMVGDGTYLMMNSEIATSVMLGPKLTIVRARQSRLRLHQPAADGDRRRELQQSARGRPARGAAGDRLRRACRARWARWPSKVGSIAELEAALQRAARRRPHHRHRHRHRPADRPPRPAATGGMSRCRRSRDARRGAARRARTMTKRARTRSGWRTDDMIRIGTNPIGWSNDDVQTLGGDIAARAVPARGRRDRLRRHGAGPQVARATRPRCKAVLDRPRPGLRLRLVLARTCSPARSRTRSAAIQPHLDLLKAMGCTVCIVCETSNAIHGDDDQAARRRARCWPTTTGRSSAPTSRRSPSSPPRRAARSSTTTTWAPSSRRAHEIDRFMADTGPATQAAARHRPRLLRRRRSGRAGAQVPGPRRPRPRQERAAADRQGRSRPRTCPSSKACAAASSPCPATGAVDFAPVLKIAAEHGYSGWLVVEAEQDPEVRNPLDYQRWG